MIFIFTICRSENTMSIFLYCCPDYPRCPANAVRIDNLGSKKEIQPILTELPGLPVITPLPGLPPIPEALGGRPLDDVTAEADVGRPEDIVCDVERPDEGVVFVWTLSFAWLTQFSVSVVGAFPIHTKHCFSINCKYKTWQ